MAKQKSSAPSPISTLARWGHIDHGKTTLTAAITKVLTKRNPKNKSVALRPDRQGA